MSDPIDPVGPPDEPADTPEATDYLIDQYISGRLSEEEAARLLQRLRERPELGQGLLEQLGVDALLREVVRSEAPSSVTGEPPHKVPPPTVRRLPVRTSRRSIFWAMAACVALVVIVGIRPWSRWQRGGDNGQALRRPTTIPTPSTEPAAPATPEEPTTSAVAVLTRTVDPVWADAGRAYAAGAPLERGWLRLGSGLAEIEFFSGARVVLEGPGELQLLSPLEAYCPAGRLSAEVPPPARGFRINTPAGAVVDLGTAFGLDVEPGGPEVHVFKGEVEVHPVKPSAAGPATQAGQSAQGVQGLKQGEAAAVEQDGTLRRFAADAAAFTTVAGLERRAAQALGRRYDAWRGAGAAWNADSSLVARFDFEDLKAEDRTLHNAAKPPEGAAPGLIPGPAAIVGCGRAEGRWPGKGALEFRSVGDRVRLEVPGEFQSFTLVAFVRVNGLDRRFNSLMMSDAFNPGAVHWQVLSDGKVRLGIAGPKGRGHADYDSPVVFAPERLGRWVQLAVVYDAAAKQITHYVDGRPVSRAATRFDVPLRIGPAELGNWNPAPRIDSVPIRHFSGRMDEFSIYRRALSEAEIRQLWAVNE